MPLTARAPIWVGLTIVACAQGCAGSSTPRLDRDLPVHRSFGSTVEASDRALSEALIRLRLAPTADRHKAVAAEYRRLRIDDAAFDHLTAAMRLNPADATAYDERARIWRDWGFPHLGIADATRAVYYAPTSAAAHNTRGTVLAAMGELELARAEFRAALALDREASFAARNLCLLDAATNPAGEPCRERRER